MEQTGYETKRLDHLGIVAGMCHKIGLSERIDELVGETERKVSVGQAVQAMVLNGLGFVGRPLYLTPEFFATKPVEKLIGPGLEAADLNDDSLGRALDRVFEVGVTEVFVAVASQALARLGVDSRFRHLDSSTFSLHGQYEEASSEQAIEISHGYSKDHRPDLKQAVVALICSHETAIPSWLSVLDGNQADKESFPAIIQAYQTELAAESDVCFIADSALYSADNLAVLDTIAWLTRVPATLKAVQTLYQQVEPAEMTPVAQEPGYRIRSLGSTYGGVRQRWVLVYSEAAYQQQVATLQRRIDKAAQRAETALTRLSRQEFATEAEAQQAAAELAEGWRFHTVELEPCQAVPHYAKPGRPAADQEPDTWTWQVRGTVQPDEAAIARQRRTKGKFVLATNQLDDVELAAAEMVTVYKTDGSVTERGFRFLKDPLFFADSLFLNKPERIMALLMVMGLALLVYALAERHLRQQLAQHQETIPDQRGQPTARPTLRRVFQMFEGIDILVIHQPARAAPERLILNLSAVHRKLLSLLGPEVEYCYQP